PLSPQKCCLRPPGFGRGRLTAKRLSVSRTRRMSCTLAPATARASGTPSPSVRRERLVPDLARSVGFGPVFFPTQRRLRHRSIEALPTPVDPFQFVVLPERLLPEPEEHPLLRQFLEVVMQRAGTTTEFPRSRLPLAAGPQDVENSH